VYYITNVGKELYIQARNGIDGKSLAGGVASWSFIAATSLR
jgi:hypothetical protein